MSKQIWIIDDSADCRALAREILSSDYSLREIASGEEALESLRAGERPDLLLVDISMPGINGLEVLVAVRGDPALRGVRVVAYTSHATQSERGRFVAVGFDDCVVKPLLTEEQLLQPVSALLA